MRRWSTDKGYNWAWSETPAGGGFAPTDIANLALWIDPSDATKYTITSSPDVDAIASSEGNAYSFAQTTAAKKPHTGSTINGLSALSFDGTDDILVYPSALFSGHSGSVFLIVRLADPLKNYERPLCSSDEASTSNMILFSAYRESSNPYQALYSAVSGSGTLLYGDETTAHSTTYLLEWHSNGSTVSMYRNGVLQSITVAQGTNDGEWYADVPSRDNVTLGATKHSSEVGHVSGLLGEQLVYDGAVVSGTDLTNLRTYLNRWGWS